jgi:hypothetical protein
MNWVVSAFVASFGVYARSRAPAYTDLRTNDMFTKITPRKSRRAYRLDVPSIPDHCGVDRE